MMQIRLKALRINEDLSLVEMARKLHVGKSTLSRWERGEMRIPVTAFENMPPHSRDFSRELGGHKFSCV